MAVRKIKCLDGLEIDPETCPIEELERVQKLCKREEDYWNTIDFLINRWTESEAIHIIDEVEQVLNILNKFSF